VKVLVTGARGFIGAGVVRAAHAQGHDVVALDRSAEGRALPDGVQTLEGDITRPEDWRSVFTGVDAVVHCAAIHRPGEIAEGTERSIEVNLRGTRLMLEAAVAAGVQRFVHLSSAKAYGEPLGFPSREHDLVNPIESYGLAKAVTEDYCRYFTARTPMRCLSLRPFSVYGPGQDFNTGYIGQLLEGWTLGAPVALSGHAGFVRDYVHIDDVVDMCLAAASEDQPFDVVNVGSGSPTTLGELVELFATLTGTVLDVRFRTARPGTIERTLADRERQDVVLGRSPIPLADGLAGTVEAHRPATAAIA
jgi:UDP-glucose 4-epimerase